MYICTYLSIYVNTCIYIHVYRHIYIRMYTNIYMHTYITFQLLRLMHDKSTAMNINIETFTVVIDASGWSMALCTSSALAFIKGIMCIHVTYILPLYAYIYQ
jgi:hypothetical protein